MRAALLLASAVLVGCGGAPHTTEVLRRPCPAVALVPGIWLDVGPRPGQVITAATVTACRDGVCRTEQASLAPQDTGWTGFAAFDDLRVGPYEVTVVLPGGTPTTQNTAARLEFPGGPECGGGVPRAEIQL